MTFREMRTQYDSYNAFSNYITINHAKFVGRIPKDYFNYFEDYCDCGSERIITTNLRTMQCADPRCPIKQALALSKLFSNFECKGVGDAICKRAYTEVEQANKRRVAAGEEPLLKTKSYLEILILDSSVYSVDFIDSAAGETFLAYVNWIKTKKLTFPQMINMLGLPEFETSAIKLFDGINTFAELRNQILQAGGISNFCEQRGFHDAMKKYWLYVSLEDIYLASLIFAQSIRPVGLLDEQICITGSIKPGGERMTKKAFIEYCNMCAHTKPILGIILEVLQDNYESLVREDVDRLCDFLKIENSLNKDIVTVEEIKTVLTENQQLNNTIQLFEIRLSTAKMSAVHIIADTDSMSDKYKAGLERGIEKDENGNDVKVLISSDEYLAEIERRKSEWTNNYKMEILSLLTNSKTLIPLQTMNLV